MKHPEYPHVFEPIRLGPITLKNRIVGNPMMSGLSTPQGAVTREMVANLGARAKTGAGLVLIGDSAIDYDYGVSHYTPLDLGNEENLSGFKALAEAAHRWGAKVGAEMDHPGFMGNEAMNRAGRRISPWPSPANPRSKYDAIVMDRKLMDEIRDKFISAADRLMRAGFDEVMVHCGHAWLMHQFLNPRVNKREDEYGGSLENRMRYPLEVLKAVHEAVGHKMAVDVRVSVGGVMSPYTELDLEEMIEFIRVASPFINHANVSVCSLDNPASTEWMCQSYYLPHMVNTDWCARAKAAGLPIPVSATGSIVTVQEAEEIIASGKADMVGMGRGTLVDDQHIVKAFSGRYDEVRPCMRCALCTDRIAKFSATRCAINPVMGRETEYPRITPALKKKKVMIVGGGPAGMECAQIATQRGHDVVLYERDDRLGGMLHTAAALPDKYDMRRYTEWMIRQTEKCGARIVTGAEAAPDIVREENPDVLIVAIGSEPMYPPIDGLRGENVCLVNDVDLGKAETGDRVVILGAGLSGSECAIPLLRDGKDVTIIDMIPARAYEMNGFGSQVWMSILRLHRELGANLIFDAVVKEITPEGVKYVGKDGAEGFIACDTVVNALGLKVNNDKVTELLLSTPEAYTIGDCLGTGLTIENAIYTGFAYAMDI